jgi:acyl-CoA thioesterase FadM
MHEISIHVYPTDCDMLGHVNHATMITFLEHARWALIEPHLSVGTTSFVIRQQVRKRGSDMLVANARIAFVCVGTDGRPVLVPDEWRRMFPHWPADAAATDAAAVEDS